MNTTQSHVNQGHINHGTTSSVASRALPVAMAALLGAFLIFGVGFSHVSAFHNAAHDVRHSNAFPCH
jgi:cobalt transporter subunit CbtB